MRSSWSRPDLSFGRADEISVTPSAVRRNRWVLAPSVRTRISFPWESMESRTMFASTGYPMDGTSETPATLSSALASSR